MQTTWVWASNSASPCGAIRRTVRQMRLDTFLIAEHTTQLAMRGFGSWPTEAGMCKGS